MTAEGAAARQLRISRAAVSTAFFCQGFAFATIITRIPAIQEEFGLSEGQLALILAAIPIVAGVGSVAAGALAVRFHSRVVLRLCGLIVSGALVAVGAVTTAGSLPGLILALVVLGFGLGSVDASMGMQGIGMQAQLGRDVMASFFAWWSLATILGALAASAAAATTLSLLAFFALVALVLIPVQILAGTRFLTAKEADEAAPDPLAASRLVPWRPLLVFGAAVVGAFVIDSSVSNWSALDLVHVLGATESVAALAYAAYALFMLIGRAVTDRVVTRLGPAAMIRIAGVVAAVGLLGVALAPTELVAIASFAVVGLGLAPILPLAFVAAGRHDPLHTGIAVARVNVGNYIGFVVGAPLVGAIGEFSSLRVGFGLLVVVALAITLTAPSFKR